MMKRHIVLIISLLIAFSAVSQNSEGALNRKYRTAVRSQLEQEAQQRQKAMQKRAQQWLVSLPNEQKLSNEWYINIETRLVDTLDEEGGSELNYVYEISYNSHELLSVVDDYPLGCYQWNRSNSARAICELTRMFVDGELRDIFRAGTHVDIEVMSRADSVEILAPLPYLGEYGDFRFMPVRYNDSIIRLSVSQASGIQHNAELAYLRAQSVRSMLDSAVAGLQRTVNSYTYAVRTRAPFRRSSIRLTVHDPFRSYIESQVAEMQRDEHVDYNIPVTGRKAENAYVLIIANQEYTNRFLPEVPFAKNDGDVVSQYLVKTVGVPERQVKVISNAARHTIMEEGVHWLTDLLKAVTPHDANGAPVPTADLYIYFVGHGFRDFDDVAYLVPNNINVDDIKSLQGKKKKGCGKKKKAAVEETATYDIALSRKDAARFASQCISVEALAAMFSSKDYPARSLTLVFDAGFDGHQRNGGLMLRPDKQPDPKARKKRTNLRSDVVILTAAGFDKTAFSFDDQRHGFLTYFLLSELRKGAANIDALTYQDIFEALERSVSKESALQNKLQEPKGLVGGKLRDGWQHMTL